MDINKIIWYVIFACVFMIFDIITGLWSSKVTGTFKSSIMREGGKHKITSILWILFGVLLDLAQIKLQLFDVSVPFTLMICSYIVVMEIGSCKENIKKANPDAVPPVVSDSIDNVVNNIKE